MTPLNDLVLCAGRLRKTKSPAMSDLLTRMLFTSGTLLAKDRNALFARKLYMPWLSVRNIRREMSPS
jgi:hypothetical protein